MGCRKIFNSFYFVRLNFIECGSRVARRYPLCLYFAPKRIAPKPFQCRLECSNPNARLAWCITTNLAGLHKVKLSLVILESTKMNTTLYVKGYSDMSVLNVTTHLKEATRSANVDVLGL